MVQRGEETTWEETIWKHILAGAGAGWMTAFVTCPLDVVKTRLQTSWLDHRHPTITSSSVTLTTLRTIWKTEGLRGLYRGLGPTLVGYLPAFSIYFPIYHASKIRLAGWRGTEARADPLVHLLSAMTAGAASNLTTNPLWVVRTRLMTQHVMVEGPLYKDAFDAFRTIYRTEGVRGFYKGASISMVGVTHVAIQFPLYEWIKRIQADDPNKLTPGNILIASTISKVAASTVTYPHEIIRTRLQVQRNGQQKRYAGVRDAIKKVYQDEGVSGFYRGLRTNILRVIPASAVTFITYEFIVKYLS